MSATTPDIIDRLVGITPGSRLDAIRAQRPAARENAQKSFLALFEPDMPGDATQQERYAIAAFVAQLHGEPDIGAFYAVEFAERGGEAGIADAVATEATRAVAHGPYGSFPAGPLSVEDAPGPVHRVAEPRRRVLGLRLAAAIEHAHMLVFHPRDASPAALQALLDAGWSTTGIVTLSQLVAFLSFQIRVIAGLRVLAATT